jgi:hypothetical protein
MRQNCVKKRYSAGISLMNIVHSLIAGALLVSPVTTCYALELPPSVLNFSSQIFNDGELSISRQGTIIDNPYLRNAAKNYAFLSEGEKPAVINNAAVGHSAYVDIYSRLNLEYYFYVAGPADVAVNVTARGALYTFASAYGTFDDEDSTALSTSSLKVGTASGQDHTIDASLIDVPPIYSFEIRDDTDYEDSTRLTINKKIKLQTNTIYGVQLSTYTEIHSEDVENGEPNLLVAYAFADPLFSLDPNNPDPNDYRFVFSDKIGNGTYGLNPPSLVPLPGSAPAFGVALLVLGAVGYRLDRRQLLGAARLRP